MNKSMGPKHSSLDKYENEKTHTTVVVDENNAEAFSGDQAEQHIKQENGAETFANNQYQLRKNNIQKDTDLANNNPSKVLSAISADDTTNQAVQKDGAQHMDFPVQGNSQKMHNTPPQLIKNFLTYMETIRGRSPRTVDEYYLDLRTFFRFLYQYKGRVPAHMPFEKISIADLDIDFIRAITINDLYEFLGYLARDRPVVQMQKNGIIAASRARKVSTIRSYFKYLKTKAYVIQENPTESLETPKTKKSLPKYLSLEQSMELLSVVEGKNALRDYAILTVFLNTGIRLAELCGLDISSIDFKDGGAKVLGKGNKERIVFFNQACLMAIQAYLQARMQANLPTKDRNALFISSRGTRINRSTVQKLVEHYLKMAGFENSHFSTHKLRHTAATLMFQNGVDVRTLKEVLGHEQLNTTQIYTHLNDEQLKNAASKNPLASFKKKT